jgi:hypothetical protein
MTCSRPFTFSQQALVIWRTGRRPAYWRADREIRRALASYALDVADLALCIGYRRGGLLDAVWRLVNELAG